MMRKMLTLLTALVLVFGVAGFARATLTDNLDGTVTDDNRGDDSALMWLQEPGLDMNYNDAVAWADSLVFAGYDDWRLPSALDFTTGLPDEVWLSTNNEFGHLYGVELDNPANAADQTPPLPDYTPFWFWTGTVDPDSPGDAYAFFWSWDGLWLNQSSADRADMTTESLLHVTAVRDIEVAPAPEPSTLVLIGCGLIGLVAFRRKLRKG